MDEIAADLAAEQHAQIYGGNMGDMLGNVFAGWGDTVRGVADYYARSRIDAEYNAPTRLAERQMMMQGEDGGLFEAGQPSGKSWLVPAAIAVGAVLLVVLVTRD